MALLFLDSFDHYSSDYSAVGASDKYTSSSGYIDTNSGRHGKGGTGWFAIGLAGVASSRSIIGGACKFAYLGGAGIFSQGDQHGTYFGINVFGDGHIQTNIGPRSTAAGLIHQGQWFYIEMQTDVSVVPVNEVYEAISIDACKIWVDGLLVLDETALGTETRAIGTSTVYNWNIVLFGESGNQTALDDLYICDGSGPAPWNTALGDVRIDVIRPNAAGALTEWTPVGAPTNFAAVADQTPDDATTQVIAAAAGPSDLYNLQDINTNDGIIGAQILISARRTEEGFAVLAPLLRHAGTTTQLPPRSLSPDYFYRNREVFVTMPNGDPLTDANVNALQAGFKRIS